MASLPNFDELGIIRHNKIGKYHLAIFILQINSPINDTQKYDILPVVRKTIFKYSVYDHIDFNSWTVVDSGFILQMRFSI